MAVSWRNWKNCKIGTVFFMIWKGAVPEIKKEKLKMRAYERLLNYVKVYTTSEDEQ